MITTRSKEVCQHCIPEKRRGGGGGLGHSILKTVFMEGKHRQANKGVCSQEALITATAIRVMRPDGRTV